MIAKKCPAFVNRDGMPADLNARIICDVWQLERIFNPSHRTDRVPDSNKPGTPGHPTEKPLELFARPMRIHTDEGDVCFEPFSGSGTHLAAAENLERRCFAMEIDAGFTAVVLERLSDMRVTPKLISH
jgi:DNA modification methylase